MNVYPHRTCTHKCFLVLFVMLFSGISLAQQYGDFSYTTTEDGVLITEYYGSGGAVTIPSSINGLPVIGIYGYAVYVEGGMFWGGAFAHRSSVTNITIPNSVLWIAEEAFYYCTGLTSINIPGSITEIARSAFEGCSNLVEVTIGNSINGISDYAFALCDKLESVYFTGNPPPYYASTIFAGSYPTVYYRYGTTGWLDMFAGRQTALWRPAVKAIDNQFTSSPEGFRFRFSGPPSDSAIVEINSNIVHNQWIPVYTNTPFLGEAEYLDIDWSEFNNKYYRILLLYN